MTFGPAYPRSAARRAAAREASEVPLAVVRECAGLLDQIESMAGRSNLNAASDLEVGARPGPWTQQRVFELFPNLRERLGFTYGDGVAVAFNSTGRDFEIAIAIAITAFSPTVALATVVGPLIEVPVMLFFVWSATRLAPRLFRAPAPGLTASEQPA